MSKAISDLELEDIWSSSLDTQENDQLSSSNSSPPDSSPVNEIPPRQLPIHKKKSKSKSKSGQDQSRKDSKLKSATTTTTTTITTTAASNKSTEVTQYPSKESENEDTIRSKESKKDCVSKSKESNEPSKRKEIKSNTSSSASTKPVPTKPVPTKPVPTISTSSASTKSVPTKSTSAKSLEIKSASTKLTKSKPATTISTVKPATTSSSSSRSSESTSQSKRPSAKRVIGITGFPEDETEAIENEILNILCCDVSEDMNECDILVMGDPSKRTLKLLEIISISKAAVVNRVWLKKSISKQQLLPTDDYIVREYKGIRRSILAKSNNTPKLFQDLSFVIIGKSTGISNTDQVQLIKNMGGEIANFNACTKRKDSTSNSKVDFVIANNGANDQDVILSGDRLVSLEWLVESILSYKVQDKSEYRYDNYKNNKKRQHPNFNNNISNNSNNNNNNNSNNNNKKLKTK